MDEQVELLRAIWNEMKALNGRVDKTNDRLGSTNGRLDATNERLDATNERLASVERGLDGLRDEVRTGFRDLNERIDAVHDRSVRADLRLATSLATLTSEVREMKEIVLVWHDEHRVDRAHLEERVDRLERHVGISRG